MKKLLLFIALTIFGLGLNAQNVGDETTIDYDGYSLKFKITSVEPAKCEASGYTDSPTDVIIPSAVTISGTEFNVTSIGSRVFTDCLSLTSIEIPNSVTSIGERAFYSSKLKSIRCLSDSVPALGKYVFDRSAIRQIQVPEESIELYKAAEQWNTFTIIKIYPYHYGDYVIEYDNYSLGFTANPLTDSCDVVCEVKPETNTAITIPSTIELAGCMVTVSSIRSSAFEDCLNLTSIEIPNSVTSIGSGAFRDCSSLTSTEIPNSVTSIGSSAFNGCSSLTSITFGDNPQLTSIGNYAFSGCSSLTSIEIPNSVTSIGDYAFYDCESLTSVTFGENSQLTSIGENAFYYCESLTSIEIPNSVTSIGECAFFGCSSLINIVVVEGNAIYDSRENCNAIIETTNNILITGCQNTTIPNSVTSIGRFAFGGSNITSIKIPNSVTSIEWGAFQVCSNLTNIEISDNVTSIEGTFYNCNKLESVIFGENSKLTSIGNRAFLYCSVLTNIDIPKSVTSIGEWAFLGCTNLASINIPESVNQIDSKAFAQCTNLSRVKCYATSVPSSPEDIFNSVPKDMTIQVPETSIDLYLDATPWKDYTITSGFNNKIEATSNMNKLGSVSGGGIYDNGEIVTLKATIKGDNEFEYWTEGGIIVSKDTIYSFTATRDRNIIGNFRKNDIPKNVMATAIDSNTIKIRWDKIVTIQSYNVYRNGEFLKNVSENSYLDEGLIAGTEYCYTITSIRDNGDESRISEEVCAKTLGESINELSSSINIYPNPVEDELFIATEVRVNEVSIYDIYGRLTMSLQVNETTSQQVVKVADLEAGVYFVNVKTENGNIVKRFVKK